MTGVQTCALPISQTVSITNLSSAALTFTSSSATSDGGTYLNYQPTSDTISPGSLTLTVQPDVSSLAAGIYTGAITLSFSDGSTGSIGVTIVVAPSGTSVSKAGREASGCTASQLAVALTSLGSNFSVPASYPTLVSAAVADNCGALLTDGTVRASFSNGDVPLSLVSQGDGNWYATWTSRNSASKVVISVAAQNSTSTLSGSAEIGRAHV